MGPHGVLDRVLDQAYTGAHTHLLRSALNQVHAAPSLGFKPHPKTRPMPIQTPGQGGKKKETQMVPSSLGSWTPWAPTSY